MKNEKAQETTTGTVIALIIGAILLVILIIIIWKGPGFFTDLVDNLIGGGGKVNIQNVALGCNTACASSLKNDFCVISRDVVFEKTGDNSKKRAWTCGQLSKRNPPVPDLENCDIDCGVISCSGFDMVKCKQLPDCSWDDVAKTCGVPAPPGS